ncbi:BTB/POZ and MATH domain-containing protein 1-like [Lolium perenne]|uniref:BTB/POZ and MATH domain-containing protein 1-like n=1 Tax=Lolium perenne TaxID=4522 RepID=UPI003A99B874
MMYTRSIHRSALLRGTLRFEIVGYKVQKAIASGAAESSVKSGAFQAGGYYWALVCTFGHGQLASINLDLLGPVAAEEDVIVVMASLRIDDPLAQWPPAECQSDDANAFSMDASYGRTAELHVPDAFHGHETRYVRDDHLIIHCTVDVLQDEEEDATTAGTVSVVPSPTISGDLHEVLLLEEYMELSEMMKKSASPQVMRVCHEFSIPNFCAVQKRHGVGEEICSGTFQVGSYDWNLTVYPSGSGDHDDDDKGQYISIFLQLVTDPGTSHVKALKVFTIWSGDGSPKIEVGAESIYTSDVRAWGFSDVVTVESCKSHYLNYDRSLTIYCSIVFVKEDYPTPEPTMDDTRSVVPVTCSDITGHLEQLLVREEVPEVRFLVEQSEISAHRLIIAARSPLLYELVVSTDNNNNRVVRIDDMRATVFRTVLRFIYTDELPPMSELMVTDHRYGKVIAGDMLAAACRFRLDRMKAMCENLVAC